MGDLDEPADPGHAGEVAIKHPQPALGEHPRVLSQRAVQEFLLGLGLVPAGRAGQHGEGGAGVRVADQQVPQLRVGRGVIPGPGRPVRGPVRLRIRRPGQRPVHRAQVQVQARHGPVVVAGLVPGRGQGHFLQPQDRRRAGCSPPGGQDRRRRHRERDMPGHARQVAQQRRHQRRVIRLRHERHQKHRPQRQRGGHAPPGGALDLSGQLYPRRHLADRVMLPGHLIQLLLQDPQPGVIRRVPAGLHVPVAADHRGRDDDRLAEHHQVPAADPAGAGGCQRGPVPLAEHPPHRAGQVSQPDRDQPPAGQIRRPPRPVSGITGQQRRNRV